MEGPLLHTLHEVCLLPRPQCTADNVIDTICNSKECMLKIQRMKFNGSLTARHAHDATLLLSIYRAGYVWMKAAF